MMMNIRIIHFFPDPSGMKIRALMVALLVYPLLLAGQPDEMTPFTGFYLGLSFSPDYCYRTLRHDGNGYNASLVKINDSLSIPKFGFTTGLNIVIVINKKFSVESGLLYSNKGYKTKTLSNPEGLYDNFPDEINPVKLRDIGHFIYLDFPVKLNYFILNQKLGIYSTAGISPNLFLSRKVIRKVEFRDGKSDQFNHSSEYDLSTINLTMIIGVGFKYDLSEKIYLRTEPVFRRSITPIKDFPIKTYLYSFGLNTGILFKF
jgi:hypothetical protein